MSLEIRRQFSVPLETFSDRKPCEIIFHGMLVKNPDGSVEVSETDKDTFKIFRHESAANSARAVFKANHPLHKVNIDGEKTWGESASDRIITWMIFLRRIHPLTGRKHSSCDVLDVALVLAAGGHENLERFTRHAVGWIPIKFETPKEFLPEIATYKALVEENKNHYFRERLELAENGDIDAQYEIATLYRTGFGPIRNDLSVAHHWYEIAALNGHSDAQFWNGALYEINQPPNKHKAAVFLQLAINSGHSQQDALHKYLKKCQAEMSTDEFAKIQAEVSKIQNEIDLTKR